MLPVGRTFAGEKRQLQELNGRLAHYLSRTTQLEQENARLIAEIHQLRGQDARGREPRLADETRDLRRMVAQLGFEKSQAEMEREKLWRDLQTVQSLCAEQTEASSCVGGELRVCEQELRRAQQTNVELQQCLQRLESECVRAEDAHRQELEQLRRQVESRAAPVLTHTHRGPSAATSAEEVQEFARGLSAGWIDTLEMYRSKVSDMEQAIEADRATLGDLQRERTLYVAELGGLRAEVEKRGRVQMHLQEQLAQMQEKFRADCGDYQMIIEQLEHERNMMADAMAEKMQEHRHLLQVKMDLGTEVAAYRALLGGDRVGRQDGQRRVSQRQRERVIDIRMPPQPYAPRASTSTTRQRMNVRYTQPTLSLRRSPVPPSRPISSLRVIPISVVDRARHQSPSSRRDMVSFAKAQAASSAPPVTSATTTKDKQTGQRENQMTQNVPETTEMEKTVEIRQVSQLENQVGSIKSSTTETKSVRVVSPPVMSMNTETESEKQVAVEKETDRVYGDMVQYEEETRSTEGPSEKNILYSVSVEDIIKKVIKPEGMEAKCYSSGETKMRYRIEESEQEDGTMKTRIVLESKVEEEPEMSEDLALDELLSQGVKKVSLEDIKDTQMGSMIKNLLSGLQECDDLGNKSVSVEIIEEPVESHSDEEPEVEQESMSSFYEPPATYFQVEELDNVPHDAQFLSDDDVMKMSMTDTEHSRSGSVQVQDVSGEDESSYFSHHQEPHEYFVSSPDDNLSEPEECGGITSYGHYGIFDDLSDERYYQDDGSPSRRVTEEGSDEYKYMSGDHSLIKESFPECIMEEEVRVSPVVQESVLEFLREDSLEPKEQLRGALEKLQSSMSGPLREELAFLAEVSRESPQNVSVDVKKVQQSSDHGTTTIVAEMNVSQTFEESGLLEAGDDIPEEQFLTALTSSNDGLERPFQGGARGEYSFTVSRERDVPYGDKFEGFTNERETASEISERHMKLGPSEMSFTFKMDTEGSHAEAAPEQELQSPILETTMEISQEKRIATVYLESPADD